MRGRMTVFGLLILVAGSAGAAWAQPHRERTLPPRGYVDLDLMGAGAVGEFATMVDGGFGGQAGLRLRLGPQVPVLLRVDGGFLVYGHERLGVCFPTPIGCRIGADVTTTNSVAYMGVGPELALEGPVAPYVFGTVGFSYFSTQSSLSGVDSYTEDLFDTRHYSDFVSALRMGGGMRFRMGGPGSVLLDLGAEYHRNGVAEYLREGDILDNPDGSITLFPNRTEANYVTVRAGVSIPFGGGKARDDRDDRRRDPRRWYH